MNDMNAVIVPKSDQINADDLIGGPRTYTIEAVNITPGTEQPVQIRLAGEARVWRPCKSMSRVLVAAWGADAKVYTGRGVTLYRDPKVKWGGMEVGGIRISHLSHIEREMLIQLTATKGKRAPHIVKPLVAEVRTMRADEPTEAPDDKARAKAESWVQDHLAAVQAAETTDDLEAVIAGGAKAVVKLNRDHRDLAAKVSEAYRAKSEELDMF